MTTDTLFTLRMAPVPSGDHVQRLAARGAFTTGALELRVLPVDADGQVIEVDGPEKVGQVLIDLRVLSAAEAEPERPSQVWQLCPGVALRLPAAGSAPVGDEDTHGFLMPAIGAFALGFAVGAGGYALGYYGAGWLQDEAYKKGYKDGARAEHIRRR